MIKIKATKIYDKDLDRGAIILRRSYLEPKGLALREIMNIHREGDYINFQRERYSSDNGKTFTEWQDVERKNYSENFGDDERITEESARVYNPVHKHYVGTLFTRYFIGGHKDAYKKFWNGERAFFDHQYIFTADSSSSVPHAYKLVKYEEGDDFSREDPRNMKFLDNNRGFLNKPIVLCSGDILVPVSAQMDRACKMLGIDVNELFPSVPHIARAIMLARGVYNEARGEYDFSFSNPVVISDLKSSRGFDEPIVCELKSGRILLVMRGSNVQYAPWHTRISADAVSYKWYSYSDDGGKTFSDAMPWSFDNGEKITSSATISEFIRSSKNGKFYWIGNVTDPKITKGNFPRYPLHICEVDEVSGNLIRDTLTVIDTKREGESDGVQLSNFTLFEDRETGEFELGLTKVGQQDGAPSYFCETWKYRIDVISG